jgi:hypothetical protein
MAVPSQLVLSHRDEVTLIVVGVYIVVIAVIWRAPVIKNVLYPFKVWPFILNCNVVEPAASLLTAVNLQAGSYGRLP